MNDAPIGLFDSGIGGTSIWREVVQRLPGESSVFIADSANAPYGEHTPAEIVVLCQANVERLLAHRCKLIVVACNTATTNAITALRAQYRVPFVGIEPAVKPAALSSKTRCIGLLATRGTLTSDFFHVSAAKLVREQGIRLIEQSGSGIVELMESGKLHSAEMTMLLTHYLKPLLAQNIDALVLGCTHYPYLREQLQRLLPERVQIIDSGAAVARQTERLLDQHGLRATPGAAVEHRWFSSGELSVLQGFAPQEQKVHIAHLKTG